MNEEEDQWFYTTIRMEATKVLEMNHEQFVTHMETELEVARSDLREMIVNWFFENRGEDDEV